MSLVFGLAFVVLLLFSAVLRAIVLWGGAAALVLLAVVILGAVVHHEKPAEGTAADYRHAQEAVTQATGQPCGYSCKVAIADQARR